MKPQNAEPQKYYTMTPSVVVFRCMDYPVALLVLHYVLIRRRIYPKFRIADMAQQLNKDKRTIRTAVKALKKLELLVLKGKPGTQYYEFNESKYAAYMLINPFASGDAPSQKMGVVPSQKLGGVGTAKDEGRPLSKSEGVKSKGIEERESKETERVLSSAGSQPPSTAAVAPEPERNLADVFESYFHQSPEPSGASQPAEGGVAVGVVSTPVAFPAPNIQSAYGNSNEVGRMNTQSMSPVGSQPPSTAAAAPEPHRDLAEEFERFFDGMPLASTCSSPSSGPQPAEGVPSNGLDCSGTAVVQLSANQSKP